MSSICMMDGNEKMVLKCKICLTECEHTIGYVHNRCSNCGNRWSIDMTLPEIVFLMRKYLNIERRELKQKTGYSLSTIKNSECTRCNKPYFELMVALVREFNKNKNSNINLIKNE